MRRVWTIVLAMSLSAGCASAIQLYPGPKRPEAQVGILWPDPSTGIHLHFVDGRWIEESGYRTVVTVLPGEHELVVSLRKHSQQTFSSASASMTTEQTTTGTPLKTTIQVEPGHYYSLSAVVEGNDRSWKVTTADITDRKASGGLEGLQQAAGY
jgi:hypothetical protein